MGLPSLATIKECAIIGGIAATPKINEWQIPDEHTQSFVDNTAKEMRKATHHVANTLGSISKKRLR